MSKELNSSEVSEKNDENSKEAVKLLNHASTNLKPKKKLGIRHIQVVNVYFLVFVAYCSRSSLSVAIVAMNDRNSTVNPNIPTFNWTNKNVVQSSFFIGYVPSQIITSFVINKMEPKWLGVILIACSSIFGIMTPSMAYWLEYRGLIAIRILQGICQGFVFPCVYHLLAQWVPPNERARLCGTVFSAKPVATIISMMSSGYIAGSWYGWPSIFYIFNGMGLLWCLSFAMFSFDSPATHPAISVKEKEYIETSLGQRKNNENAKIPWKEIVTSVPFWALSLTQAGYTWCFWMQQTQMPTYIKHVMKFNIESSGFLSALPYLLQFLLSFVFSFISDYLLNKKMCSIGTARKTMNSIGTLIPALIFIILQSCGPEDSTKAIILMNLGIALNGACFCGFMLNQIDLSPRFVSVLVGISNGPGQGTGLLAPLFVQAVVKDETNPNEWKYVFYTAAGIYIISGLIFIFFGSAKVQSWDSDKHKSEKIDKVQTVSLADII